MKKGIIFSIALLCAVIALIGCSKKDDTKTNGNGQTTTQSSGKSYGNLEDGLVQNYVEAKTFTASRADERENQYTAYSKDGVKIGDYKTIAAAINAAVDKDVKDGVYGSYVTKMNDTQKLFFNKEGYTNDNDDQFWFYEDGNKIDSYFCWDGATHMTSLRNSDYIVHAITNFGSTSQQSWNSYGLLDSYGERYNTIAAQSYELSATMDAAILEFSMRRGGITKLEYEIDLSNVTITPPYDGNDKTYAFIGFYAWQDYYVIAVGIACDTSTGNWYQFVGTSRDDSFSDVTYDTGACVMTSTWDEQAGCFRPDADSVTAQIETVNNYDEEADEYYQTDVTNFTFSNGTKYTRVITDSLVNSYFSGVYLSMENSYIFIAGLDIRNKVTAGVHTENTDYFNGSAFKNLAITSAKGYVPSEEELDEVDYGYAIDSSWRGKWHDLLLNNNEDTEDFVDYVILNTNACVDYSAVNKKDVFSFSYDGETSSQTVIGKNLATYQNKINALKDITIENSLTYESRINEISTWLADKSTVVPDKYKNVLDFAPYYAALEVFNSIQLSEAGEQFLAKIEGMTTDDAAQFLEIYNAEFDKLSEDDKIAVRISFGATLFDSILQYAAFFDNLENATQMAYVYTSYVFCYYSNNSYVTSDAKTELTAKEAYDELVRMIGLISAPTRWTGDYKDYNDDPNNLKTNTMNGDNNFYPSLRVIMLVEYFESAGIELPQFIRDSLEEIDYNSFYTEFYYPLAMVTKIALKIENGTIKAISDLTDEELSFLNEYWTYDYIIGQQIAWNWVNGNRLMTYYNGRSVAISYMAGAPANKAFYQYADELNEFLKGLGYTIKSNGWGVNQSEIK